MPTVTLVRLLALSALLGCADPSISAPLPSPVAPMASAPRSFATCGLACAQHCNTVLPSDRPACEQGQVACGCSPGMRRPPLGVGAPVAEPVAEPVVIPVVEDVVPACFGPSLPLTVWAATPYAEVRFGGSSGLFLIDFGTTGSSIDPAAFDPPPDGSLGCYAGMDFFGPRACTSLRRSDHRGVGAPFRQAGILGTDVLSAHSYVLDYRGGRLHRSDAFCSEAALAAASMIPLATSGYGPHRVGVHVPAITIRVGSATAPAQLDTGFADRRVRHSININRAFFDAIVASGAVLEPTPSSDLTLSTCVPGVSEPVRAYRLRSGVLEWMARDESVARAFDDATLFLKDTPAAAARCGGIGTWSEPGAQLGASFAESAGVMAFDTRAGVVWIASETGAR